MTESRLMAAESRRLPDGVGTKRGFRRGAANPLHLDNNSNSSNNNENDNNDNNDTNSQSQSSSNNSNSSLMFNMNNSNNSSSSSSSRSSSDKKEKRNVPTPSGSRQGGLARPALPGCETGRWLLNMCVYIYIYIYIERERESKRFSECGNGKRTAR